MPPPRRHRVAASMRHLIDERLRGQERPPIHLLFSLRDVKVESRLANLREPVMKHFVSILVLILIHSAAWGDPGPLVSTKKEFHKGKFLLVMLYPKENSLNGNNPLNKM